MGLREILLGAIVSTSIACAPCKNPEPIYDLIAFRTESEGDMHARVGLHIDYGNEEHETPVQYKVTCTADPPRNTEYLIVEFSKRPEDIEDIDHPEKAAFYDFLGSNVYQSSTSVSSEWLSAERMSNIASVRCITYQVDWVCSSVECHSERAPVSKQTADVLETGDYVCLDEYYGDTGLF